MTNVIVDNDYCQAIEQERKQLLPFVHAINNVRKNDGSTPYMASVVRDKLVVNSKVYKQDELNSLPNLIKPQHLFTQSRNGITGFFKKFSPLSNHHPAPQTITGITYNCNEQFYFDRKAQIFNDNVTGDRILREKDPGRQKQLSKDIQNVDNDRWKQVCQEIMKQGLYAKFTQNPQLKEFLLDTGTNTLVECNRNDKYWGIGMAINDPKAFKKNSWLGSAENQLGILLMEIRRELRGHEPTGT